MIAVDLPLLRTAVGAVVVVVAVVVDVVALGLNVVPTPLAFVNPKERMSRLCALSFGSTVPLLLETDSSASFGVVDRAFCSFLRFSLLRCCCCC